MNFIYRKMTAISEEKHGRFRTTSHSVYNVSYHIIFCPKYRRCLLTDEVENRLKELLLFKSDELHCTIDTMEIMPDHVHLFLKARPDVSIPKIVGVLKGYISYNLRREFPLLKRFPSLWTRSYYVETIGHISEKVVQKYIQDQKKH